jgi:hypothetical protein
MDTPETIRGNDPRRQDGIDYDQSQHNPSDSAVFADGGTAPCPGCDTDLLVQRSVKDDEDWWCHGCDHHFSSDDLPGGMTIRADGGHPPGHNPGSSTADSSPDGEYYVVDEARPAVVDGPLPMARAKTLANEFGPGHIVAKRSAIELLEAAGNTTVRWKTDDVDVVTDGGSR